MDIILRAWDYWLIVAFIAPIFWAIVNIVDVYFVGEVFDDELDGVMIMGLFQILPWSAVFFVEFTLPNYNIIVLSMLAGFVYLTAMYFYFKALFIANDGIVVSIFWNISILLLPIFAFFITGERLTQIQIMGLCIAFIGASLISLNREIKQQNLSSVFMIMMGAVTLLSISMAISGNVYDRVSFCDGFLFFSLGAFIGGVFFMLIRFNSGKKKKRISILQLNKKYFVWFFLAELFTLLGIIFSQRAIDLSPSVSFVTVIESAQAFFILVISAIIFIILSLVKNKKQDILKAIYENQLVGYKIKIVASITIAVGIYMLNV